MIKKAFSLIELMVVIAIIAVLAAVAIPAYKSYMVASRMGSITSIIDGYIRQMIVYANTNGQFPNPVDLGLGDWCGADCATVQNPEQLSPYFSYLHFTERGSNKCGKLGEINGQFNTTALGLGSNHQAGYSCILANVGQTVKVKCFYSYGAGSSYTTGFLYAGTLIISISGVATETLNTNDILPGWELVNTSTSPGNFQNVQDFLDEVEPDLQCM